MAWKRLTTANRKYKRAALDALKATVPEGVRVYRITRLEWNEYTGEVCGLGHEYLEGGRVRHHELEAYIETMYTRTREARK
jgi:hypothetical protein